MSRNALILPIEHFKTEIISKVDENRVVIIVSETGSGKTTRVPRYVLENCLKNRGVVAVTQPRRIAAITVANRVAKEMGSKTGEIVGYSVRFEEMYSEKTKIKYLTDGMLVKELIYDRNLNRYSVIILDEAHERSLNTDILVAVLKKTLEHRTDLKIIIMSATLSVFKFSSHFPNSKVINIKGNLFDVKTFYLKKNVQDYVTATVTTILQIHTEQPEGHILVFLSGRDEIERTKIDLKNKRKNYRSILGNMKIYCMFASMPTKKQSKAFANVPPGTRKVILATNIAETSITINDVVYVIDSGFSKKNFFDFKNGIEVILKQRITKSEAFQRKGRAGRVKTGVCYRLYSEETFQKLEKNIVPEIVRCNLCGLVILLKILKVEKLKQIDFLDTPGIAALNRSCRVLKMMGGIDEKSNLTELGRQVAHFPLNPFLAKALIKSHTLGVSSSMLSIVSMMTLESIWDQTAKKDKLLKAKIYFSEKGLRGDCLAFLKIYEELVGNNFSRPWCKKMCINRREAIKSSRIRAQLAEKLQSLRLSKGKNASSYKSIRTALYSSLYLNAASLQANGQYKTTYGDVVVKIHPASVLFGQKPKFVVFQELVSIQNYSFKGKDQVELHAQFSEDR